MCELLVKQVRPAEHELPILRSNRGKAAGGLSVAVVENHPVVLQSPPGFVGMGVALNLSTREQSYLLGNHGTVTAAELPHPVRDPPGIPARLGRGRLL